MTWFAEVLVHMSVGRIYWRVSVSKQGDGWVQQMEFGERIRLNAPVTVIGFALTS